MLNADKKPPPKRFNVLATSRVRGNLIVEMSLNVGGCFVARLLAMTHKGGILPRAIEVNKIMKMVKTDIGEVGQKKDPDYFAAVRVKSPGNVLLSREFPLSSAPEGLTTVFGMGTGVALLILPPG